jgi:hypothetical protein
MDCIDLICKLIDSHAENLSIQVYTCSEDNHYHMVYVHFPTANYSCGDFLTLRNMFQEPWQTSQNTKKMQGFW